MSIAIVDGQAFEWVETPLYEDWTFTFSQSDNGQGWLESYKRRPNNAYTQIDGSTLRVIDEDIPFTQSGGVYLKTRPNWRVGLRVRVTNKGGYWNQGFKRTPATGRFNTSYGSSLMLPTSDAYIVLESGDYLSIDVDGDFSDIAQFRVVQGGEIVFDGSAVNRNVNITIDEVRHLVPYQSTIQGPIEETGGDLDLDGVIDSEDFDPNNPYVQTPEDVPNVPGDEVAIITDDNRAGYSLVVTSKLQKDPFPLLGYLLVASFFILVLRRGA